MCFVLAAGGAIFGIRVIGTYPTLVGVLVGLPAIGGAVLAVAARVVVGRSRALTCTWTSAALIGFAVLVMTGFVVFLPAVLDAG